MSEKNEMSDSMSECHFNNSPKKLIFPFKNKNDDSNIYMTTLEKLTESNLNKNINISESQSVDDPEYLEQQLSLFYENLMVLYKKKLFSNILQEFDGKEELLYKGSRMSFNIFILKIKCLMKLLKTRFEEVLKIKHDTPNYFEVEKVVNKISSDFKKINIIINENDYVEYEIITQIYCKFLLIISVIKSKKDENIESFFYLNLGINMMKLYFIRQKIANDIKTYLTYARLLILFINQLLSDNNYKQALMYITILLKICEVSSIKIIKQKLNNYYQNKFIQLAGYAFLFTGYCFEVSNNYNLVLKSYKQAYYLLNKHNTKHKDLSHLFFYSQITDISKELMYKVSNKLIKEKIERIRKKELEEIHRKEAEHQKEQEEKQYLLKLIANGFSANVDKFSIIQKKLYDNILTKQNLKIMNKLDNELISVVYKDQKNKQENNDLSMNIKRNLCHYEIYSKLMTDKFREYITKNKHFGFSNPQQEKNSLDSIQGYLNTKMKLSLKTNGNPNALKKYRVNPKLKIKGINSVNMNGIIYRNFNTDNKRINTDSTASYNIYLKTNITTDRSIKENKSNKDINKSLLNHDSYMAQTYRQKPQYNFSQKSYSVTSPSSHINNNKINKTNSLTFNKKSIKDSISCDYNAKLKKLNNKENAPIINVKMSKKGFSKSYFKKYTYLDSLIHKELDFQKILLNTKHSNSKLYFSDFNNELNNCEKTQKEDIYKKYLVIKDKANSKFRNYKMDDIIKLKNMKNEPRIIANIFKSFSSKYSQGKSAKNAMKKVISKYINAKKGEKRSVRYIDDQTVLKKNESYIMDLNNEVKEINYLLQVKTSDIKKTK